MNPEPKPRIYTVGHGNAPFLDRERILRIHGVATIIDVRSAPYSKYSADFRKSALAEFAATAGLGYRWMGDRLGGSRTGSAPELTTPTLEPTMNEAEVSGALAEVVALNQTGPVALLCAERPAALPPAHHPGSSPRDPQMRSVSHSRRRIRSPASTLAGDLIVLDEHTLAVTPRR